MFKIMTVSTLALAGLALAAFTASAPGATITGSFTSGTLNNTPTLTDVGTLDWRLWNATADDWSTVSPPLVNEKVGGTAISDPSVVFIDNDGVGTNNKLSAGFATHKFAWTNGDSIPTSQSGFTGAGLAIRGTTGTGTPLAGGFLPDDSISVNISAASTNQHTITIYGSATRAFNRLTLSATAATTEVDVFSVSNTSVTNWIYTATWTPNSATDVLTAKLDWDGVNRNSTNSALAGFSLSAVAVSVIPEPASLALLGLGGLVMLGRRRRMA